VEPSLIASYALAITGVVIVGWTGWVLNAANVNRSIGNPVLVRLLKQGDTSRAGKICAIVPDSYFSAVGAAIQAAVAAQSRDRLTLAAAIDPAFAAKAAEITARWRSLLERGVLGGMVALAGVGLAMSDRFVPVPLYVAGGLTLLALAWFALRRNAVVDSIEAARLEIVPVLITAIVDGQAASPAAIEERPSRVETPTPVIAPRIAVLAPASVSGPTPAVGGPRSLRSGTCPLCAHTTISRIEGTDDRFYNLVCRGCGHAQQFADLAKLDDA